MASRRDWSLHLQPRGGTCTLELPCLHLGIGYKNLKFEFICSTHQKYLLLPSGSRSTPSTSIMSKCVPANQLGKIFSVTQALATLFGMAMKYANTQASIDISPSTFYINSRHVKHFSALQSDPEWIPRSFLLLECCIWGSESYWLLHCLLLHLEEWEEVWATWNKRWVRQFHSFVELEYLNVFHCHMHML